MTAGLRILHARSLGYGSLTEHFHVILGLLGCGVCRPSKNCCQVMSTSTVFLMLNVLWTR